MHTIKLILFAIMFNLMVSVATVDSYRNGNAFLDLIDTKINENITTTTNTQDDARDSGLLSQVASGAQNVFESAIKLIQFVLVLLGMLVSGMIGTIGALTSNKTPVEVIGYAAIGLFQLAFNLEIINRIIDKFINKTKG